MAPPKSADLKTLPLGSSGSTIPSVGFGCWQIPREVTARVVYEAIEAGYRHIDGAACYRNEKEVGEGIRRAVEAGLVTRADLHVTTKLWLTYLRPEHVEAACRRSLEDMGLDYVDLYLIHYPISLKFVPFEKRYPPGWFHDPDAPEPRMEPDPVPLSATWSALEKLHDAGLVRNLGLANFNCQAIRDLVSYARVKPAALQVELHPLLQQQNLVRYAQSVGMHVTAFSPLGHGGSYGTAVSAMQEPAIKKIAKKTGKTPAQVVLRWNLERGVSVIPKSEKKHRIAENLALFDFALSEADMAEVAAVDRAHRFNDPGQFCQEDFNTFFPIFD